MSEEVDELEEKVEKSYKCKYCDFVASSPLELANHVRLAHSEGRYKCKYCDFVASSPLELANHVRLTHPEARRKEEREEVVEEPKTEEDIRAMIAIRGREALNELKRRRLEEVLTHHPKVSSQARRWVLWKWDTDDSVKEDPNRLVYIMMNVGIPDSVAYEIASTVWQLEAKYGHLVSQRPPPPFPLYRQELPPPPLPPQPYIQPQPQLTQPFTLQQPAFQPQYQQQFPHHSQQTYYPPQPQYVTPPTYEIERIVESKIKSISDKLEKISVKEEEYVEIMEPVLDADGKPVLDEKGQVVLAPIKIPKSMYVQYMMMRRMPARKEEPEEVSLLKKRLAELEKELEEERKRREREEVEKKIEEVKSIAQEALQEAREAKRSPPGEYQRDDFRLVGHSIDRFADVIMEKKPVDKILNFLYTVTSKRPHEKPEGEAGSLIEEELKRRGAIEV